MRWSNLRRIYSVPTTKGKIEFQQNHLIFIYGFSIYILGCSGAVCNITNHEECKVSASSQGQKCVCKRGFFKENGECRSRPIMITVTFKCTLPFDERLLDLFNPYTIGFINEMKSRLSLTLVLITGSDNIVIVLFFQGSTGVTFDVLLPSNTTQNETTIANNLQNDILQNATLSPYFPVAADPSDTILAVNSKSL